MAKVKGLNAIPNECLTADDAASLVAQYRKRRESVEALVREISIEIGNAARRGKESLSPWYNRPDVDPDVQIAVQNHFRERGFTGMNDMSPRESRILW